MGMSPWLVVPTLGNRDAMLLPLLHDAGMPAVIVHTGADLRAGGRYLREDPGAQGDASGRSVIWNKCLNIQEWWLAGIREAMSHHAETVVLCNDDVSVDPGALVELAAHVANPGPAFVWPSDPEHASTRVTGVTGYCFALDPSRVLPDPSFQWWWGEHDMELRVRRMFGDGAAMAVHGLGIRHERHGWSYDRDVDDLIEADRSLFRRRYPYLADQV